VGVEEVDSLLKEGRCERSHSVHVQLSLAFLDVVLAIEPRLKSFLDGEAMRAFVSM
jgi:hypothetical protein